MADFMLLMHDDAQQSPSPDMWDSYWSSLREKGVFAGGSSIGAGETLRRRGEPAPLSRRLVGYIRIEAENLDAARALVAGNPVYECGGTVEVRALPRD